MPSSGSHNSFHRVQRSEGALSYHSSKFQDYPGAVLIFMDNSEPKLCGQPHHIEINLKDLHPDSLDPQIAGDIDTPAAELLPTPSPCQGSPTITAISALSRSGC